MKVLLLSGLFVDDKIDLMKLRFSVGMVFVVLFFVLSTVGCNSNNSSGTDKVNLKDSTMADTFDNLKETLKNKPLKVENISFDFNGKKHLATFVYDSSTQNNLPGIVIAPEWWGLNNYIKTRAQLFATLGYAVLAIDPFGNGQTAANPQEAMALTKPFYDDAGLGVQLMKAAIKKIKSMQHVDTSEIASVGYCFGGYLSLSAGVDNIGLKSSVGFHPSMGGIKPEGNSTTKLLVCFGEDDGFEKDNVAAFKQRIKDAGIDMIFKTYPDAKHAFTNPGATEVGEKYGIPIAYNQNADEQSWNEAKTFLKDNLK